jgi:tRNA U34 2-thiouridine synthase MnmA/TrmU
MEKKALALLSGGLDSSLAVKIILDQGIAVTAVNFVSPFCNCTSRNAGCKHQARKVADEFGISIQVIPKGMDYIRMVQHPKHGHGRGMNPCIDCRIYMLRKVKEMMPTHGSFIITGEVLGQRPMSQHRRAIETIEKESGLEGLILRPLSAGHFAPTIPEQEGTVDREKLLSLSGRSRKPQIELAEKLGVKDYPCPAGGCLLTDPVIAERLRDLFMYLPGYNVADLQLLKTGRHFRLARELKLILGRNKAENEILHLHSGPGYRIVRPANFRGPCALLCGHDIAPEYVKIAGNIMAAYSNDDLDSYSISEMNEDQDGSKIFVGPRFARDKFNPLCIGQDGSGKESPSKREQEEVVCPR